MQSFAEAHGKSRTEMLRRNNFSKGSCGIELAHRVHAENLARSLLIV